MAMNFNDTQASATKSPVFSFILRSRPQEAPSSFILYFSSLLSRSCTSLAPAGRAFAHTAVWYVDVENTAGPWDGTSWGTAFQTIREGVDAAQGDGGGEVSVAEGCAA